MCGCNRGAAAVIKGLCRRCWVASIRARRATRLWTPAIHTELRLAYAQPTKTACSAALTQLQTRTGWPRHAFVAEARRLNIVREIRRPWTQAEDRILENALGESSAAQIARRLNRSVESVQARAALLDLSSRVRAGYAIKDLRDILGAPYARVREWIDAGLLGEAKATPTGLRITDESLVRFIRQNISLLDLRRTDQTFLKGILNGSR